MSDSPAVIGINRTQDASVCLIRGPSDILSIQKERITRKKHHWGRLGDLAHYLERVSELSEPIDVVVECYSSDPEIARMEEYIREVSGSVRFRGPSRIVQMSHHLAHLYSAYFTSPFDTAAVMVIDCMGSRTRDIAERFPGQRSTPSSMVEVASFYQCDGRSVRCLAKQLWDIDWAHPVGLGCFYFLLTRAIFPGEGNEGKVMGLAPYGDPDALRLPPLRVDRSAVTIPLEWQTLFRESRQFRHFVDGSGSLKDCADLAACGQRCFEDALIKVTAWLRQETGCRNLCYAGGTALNCVANGRLVREAGFEEVFIPPSPHDGGTALGCAIYGWAMELGLKPEFRSATDFLGPHQPAWAPEQMTEPDLFIEEPGDLIQRTASLLAAKHVIALFHGRSELGPRALGHRSILADPRRADVRTWINRHVKGREEFRPFAPAARLEVASSYFEIDRPIPFMQFAVPVRPEFRNVIPAVTHVDGSARLQTVTREDNQFFYDLIAAFEDLTGMGVLLNTSLNTNEEPLVETPNEAISCFKRTPMSVLVIPPFLIRKRDNISPTTGH